MGLPERIQITNSIIYKSLNKAIAEKKETMARLAATFAGGTHSTREAGRKSYSANMLRFYEQTGDTANYLTNALTYYNTYLMTVNIDSVKRTDSINRSKAFAAAPTQTQIVEGTKTRETKMVRYAPSTQAYTNELNHGARSFYKMTNQPQLLAIATEWIKRGLDFYESPEALDTYARLLYKTGSQTMAIDALSKAVELEKQRGSPAKDYEVLLDKMKRKEAVNDFP